MLIDKGSECLFSYTLISMIYYYTFSPLPIRVAKALSLQYISLFIRKVEHPFVCLQAIHVCVSVLISLLGCQSFKIHFVGTFYIVRELTLWIRAANLYPLPRCPVSCLLTCFYVYFSKVEFCVCVWSNLSPFMAFAHTQKVFPQNSTLKNVFSFFFKTALSRCHLHTIQLTI